MKKLDTNFNYLAKAGGHYFVSATTLYGVCLFGVFEQRFFERNFKDIKIGFPFEQIGTIEEFEAASEFILGAGWSMATQYYSAANIWQNVIAALERLGLTENDLQVYTAKYERR